MTAAFPTDPYGKGIEPGKRVAFNYCGGVRLGTVESVHTAKRYDRSEWRILIRRQASVHGEWTELTSRVTSPQNLVVLD